MTEKEIKKLNRQDLLILLAEQRERADNLELKLKGAEQKLQERRLAQEECGSMAEAALRFHDVFRAVDEAAALFEENVRLRQKEQEEAFRLLETENTRKSEQILRSAQQEADNTRLNAEQILRDAEEQARQIIAKAHADAEQTLQNANNQAAQIISQAETEADQQAQRADEIVRKAQEYVAEEMEKIEQRWEQIHEKIESMSREYIWLRGIINREEDTPRQKAGQIIQNAQVRAEEIVAEAQEHAAMEMEKIDSRWNRIYDRIRGMEKEYSWLQGIINTKAGEEV